ncbi:MAG: ferritin [Sedimentisphaerales bacterium]|nr:ferritin [Sedimentisphaerales bacterium]
MISKKMQDAFNAQLNAELYSSYLYLSMAAHFASMDLQGCANWMQVQAQEEMVHAMKFYNYINERGGRVLLKAIDAPATEWDSPLAVFEAVLAHEQKVTALINDRAAVADAENDRASQIFLQWFINEQVEEESSAEAVVRRLKLMADAPGGLFMLDQELGKRVFTPPADQTNANG